MELKNIYTEPKTVILDTFKGLNRRKRTEYGEFADMENLSHEEYPCICSKKGHTLLDFALPEGVQAVRFLASKSKNQAVTGFTGVAYNTNTSKYEIYLNGESVRTDIGEFTDIVDYNGMYITFPELKGYNTAAMGRTKNENMLAPFGHGGELGFSYKYRTNKIADGVTCSLLLEDTTYKQGRKIMEELPEGTKLMLTDCKGDFENNNTYFPQSEHDFSEPTRITNMVITGIACNAPEYGLGTTSMALICTNNEGEEVPWPKGGQINEYGNGQPIYSTGRVSKYVPSMTYGCVANNRVWGCSKTGEYIYCSALGKPFEFTELNDVSSDSWCAQVGTPGKFTGISPWQNRVVVFKSDSIHIVYGDLPQNFSIERSYGVGCVDRSSILQVGNKLIWLYSDGFYTYSGGVPVRISQKLDTRYATCTAFTDGRRYYGICTKEDGSRELVVYDTELGLWDKISDMGFISGDLYKGTLYGCTADRVYTLCDGEYGDFYGETGDMFFESFRDKALVYVTIRCRIDTGFLNVYTKVDKGDWEPHKGITESGKHRLPIRYKNGDIIKFRFEGCGEVCIYEMSIDANIK